MWLAGTSLGDGETGVGIFEVFLSISTRHVKRKVNLVN